MKHFGTTLVLTLLLLVSARSQAQDYKMALGVRLSSNPAAVGNSITFKYFLNQKTAVETLLSFTDPLAIGVLVEQHHPLASNNTFKIFYGGGAYVGFGGRRNVGLQGVGGLDYKIASAPVDLSLDWKPELNVWKEFSFEPGALGISARFTF